MRPYRMKNRIARTEEPDGTKSHGGCDMQRPRIVSNKQFGTITECSKAA
jgi:hypothetical protein